MSELCHLINKGFVFILLIYTFFKDGKKKQQQKSRHENAEISIFSNKLFERPLTVYYRQYFSVYSSLFSLRLYPNFSSFQTKYVMIR